MAIRKSSNTGIPFGGTSGRPSNPANGQPYFNGDIGRLELYTSGTGWQNIVQETPGVASITGTYIESNNTGTFSISGTNFVSGAIAYAIGTNGVEYQATTTTYNSLVQLTATWTNLSAAYEPYDIKIVNPSNLFGLLPDAFYINQQLSWVTSSGSLGTVVSGNNVSFSITASDPESGPITYSSLNIPIWLSLNSSTGAITGTAPAPSSNTTYSFDVNATDGANSSISRSFSISVTAVPSGGTITTSGSYRIHTFTGSGTFTTPNAISAEYLVVAGGAAGGSGLAGGGGAGGFRTNVGSATTFNSGSYTVTIGAGGAPNSTNMSYGGNGENSSISGNAISISATGGGSGGYYNGVLPGLSGGSGGGGGGTGNQGSYSTAGSGNAGGYSPSEGNNGGRGTYWGNSKHLGGGGGGAGGAGSDTPDSSIGGNGGSGSQSSISGTATYYAGGGGGSGRNAMSSAGGYGGSSIGGRGAGNNGSPGNGVTNTGSGGGGGDYADGSTSPAGGAGGSGIVIIRYQV